MYKIVGFLFLSILFTTTFSQVDSYADIEILMIDNEYDKVIDTVLNYVTTEDNVQLMYYLSIAYRENYQFEKSLEVCKKVFHDHGELEEFKKIEASNYISLNNYKSAIGIYEDLYKEDSVNIHLKVQLAKLYYASKMYKEATLLYIDLIDQDSTNSYFNKQMGLALLETGNTNGIAYLEHALDLNPKDQSIAVKLANFYNNKQAFLNAIGTLDFAIKYNPDSYQLYKHKGYTLYLTEEYDSAVKCFDNVLRLGDTSMFTINYLGYSYFELEDYEKSYQLLNKVLEVDTTKSKVYYYQSVSARKMYKTQESIDLMKKAMKLLFPPDAVVSLYYLQMAENYIVHGSRFKISNDTKAERESYNRAINNFKAAYEQDTTKTQALYQIASIYHSYLNEKTKALESYQKYKSKIHKHPEETDGQYELRLEYVNNNIRKLKEELHFEGKLNNNN